MERNFTLAGELTEEGVSGEWRVAPTAADWRDQSSIQKSSRLNLEDPGHGGRGLAIACAVLGVLFLLFPGHERRPKATPTPTDPPPVAVVPPEPARAVKPRREPVTAEGTARGLAINGNSPQAAATPASSSGQPADKPPKPAEPSANGEDQGSAPAQNPGR